MRRLSVFLLAMLFATLAEAIFYPGQWDAVVLRPVANDTVFDTSWFTGHALFGTQDGSG